MNYRTEKEKNNIFEYLNQFSEKEKLKYPIPWLNHGVFANIDPLCKLLHMYFYYRHVQSCWSKRYHFAETNPRHITIACNYNELKVIIETDDSRDVDDRLEELKKVGLIKIVEKHKEKSKKYELVLKIFEVESKMRLVLDKNQEIVTSDLVVTDSDDTSDLVVTDESRKPRLQGKPRDNSTREMRDN